MSIVFFFFKQKKAYELRISDWSSDVCSSDLRSLEALDWRKRQGCRQFLFKYCSTFDSTPAGNIGPVAEALLDALEAPVAVVCPAFPATGRSLFMGHSSEERRVGQECVSTVRSRWSAVS